MIKTGIIIRNYKIICANKTCDPNSEPRFKSKDNQIIIFTLLFQHRLVFGVFERWVVGYSLVVLEIVIASRVC